MRTSLCLASGMLALMITAAAASAAPALEEAVAAHRAQSDSPALGAAVVSSAGVRALHVEGLRRAAPPQVAAPADAAAAADNVAAPGDAFHIGAIAHTLTATVAGALVETGTIEGEATIGELLPEAAQVGRRAYRDVTLSQLLAHEAGLPPLTTDEALANLPAFAGSPREQRREFVTWILQQPPHGAAGEEYVYSDAGVAVAAVMLEAATDASWEDLVTSHVFTPLGMDSAGFGSPGEVDDAGAFLWGHRWEDGAAVPVDPRGDDQPPGVLMPTGDVHASLPDMAAFAAAWLRALQEGSELLSADTARAMAEPRIGGGIGWDIQPLLGHEQALISTGSTEAFYMVMVLIPEEDRGYLVAANAAGGSVEKQARRLLKTLVEEEVGG